MTHTLNRRAFVKTAAGASTLGLLGAAGRRRKKPNVLFVMTDQGPTACLACYGNPIIRTPARDAIAAEGIRFNTHFLASYACSPSRANMITGRYTHNHGVYQNGIMLEDSVPAMGGLFGAAGYETVWIGKSHLGGENYVRPGEGYRRKVVVDHPGGWQTRYAHLHRIRVDEDDRVRRGDRVGTVGASGNASGDHLHYEVRRNGVPVDPRPTLGR